jgi:hypothetical protein
MGRRNRMVSGRVKVKQENEWEVEVGKKLGNEVEVRREMGEKDSGKEREKWKKVIITCRAGQRNGKGKWKLEREFRISV